MQQEAAGLPFVGPRIRVPTDWVDVNGHMNATHYTLVIYAAHVRFTDLMGLGDEYVHASGCGKAVVESHMSYEREVSGGDELRTRSWLLAVDAKRLRRAVAGTVARASAGPGSGASAGGKSCPRRGTAPAAGQ